MNDINHLAALNLDKDLNPLSSSQTDITEREHYKVGFSPEFPPIGDFRPNQFNYESLTEDSISILARRLIGTEFHQVGIILPRHLKNGSYPVVAWGEGVSTTIIADGSFIHGHNGTVTFEKDKEFITAKFNYEITYLQSTFKVIGNLYLRATGPL